MEPAVEIPAGTSGSAAPSALTDREAVGDDAVSGAAPAYSLGEPERASRSVNAEQAVRLREKAAVLEECAELARLYEAQGADAGFVRVVLAGRASSARRLVEELCPLEEAPDTAEGASSSGPGETETFSPPGLGLTAIQTEPSPGPLTERGRLAYIATSLSHAIDTLEDREARRLMGGAGKAIADYLRTIQALARGQASGPVPDPQSLRVDAPAGLRLVK